jgi:hypothetical protein
LRFFVFVFVFIDRSIVVVVCFVDPGTVPSIHGQILRILPPLPPSFATGLLFVLFCRLFQRFLLLGIAIVSPFVSIAGLRFVSLP